MSSLYVICYSRIQVKAMLLASGLVAQAATDGNRELFKAVLTAMREKLDREQV